VKIDSPYECDVCKTKKGEGNRWLMGDVLHKRYPDSSVSTNMIGLRPWQEEIADEEGVKHLCSDKCALTWQANELIKLGR
jgi:hypothetical protein